MKYPHHRTMSMAVGALTIAFGVWTAATPNLNGDASGDSQSRVQSYAAQDKAKPIPPFVERSLDWLAAAQFENGGWGAGTHDRQELRDPRAVTIDPATTAFAGLALIRSGNTLRKGPYRENVNRTLTYLLESVEAFPEEGPFITDVTGTQPQAKLGRNIDASMVAQFFTRVLPEIKNDKKLTTRVENALDKCLRKLQLSQQSDGSWNDGGWAPVLQSAMANSALEMAKGVGREVDEDVLRKSRAYQEENINEDGEVRTDAAAGVSLYSIASGQRAAAPVARELRSNLDKAKRDGLLPDDAIVSKETLDTLGYGKAETKTLLETYRRYEQATEMLGDDDVLSGFGNNGGEEFLSYMMTSESLAATGGTEWEEWYTKMSGRFEKIQNGDGSWSGHHCITSPVFSTAAVIMAITADRDLDFIAKR